MAPRLALAVSLAVGSTLAGCAGPEWAYEKRGASVARLDHDLNECRKEALRPSTFAIFRSHRFDQEILNRCMERKGYTPRPPESGAVDSHRGNV